MAVERYDRLVEIDEFARAKGQTDRKGLGYVGTLAHQQSRREKILIAMKKDAEQARLL